MIPKQTQALLLINWFKKAGLIHLTSGKTREMFKIPGREDLMLIYATNRISIFDIVLNAVVFKKGEVLTALTIFWLTKLCPSLGIQTHLVAFGSEIDRYLPNDVRNIPDLQKRCLVVRFADVLASEAIVRGHLTGSGYKDYTKTGMVCGIKLGEGLHDGSLIDPAIFTPSTKEEMGKHDRNISFEEMIKTVGEDVANQVKTLSLSLFTEANRMVNENGVVIADTKFEWAVDSESDLVFLVDEILTPDSSRFWPAQAEYSETPPSFDKQPVRNWGLEVGIKADHAIIPSKVVLEATADRYREAIQLIYGDSLEQFQKIEMGIG
ncbi:MAG: phosphoribosylaminoimidazolesuccinocarboxamide synthase [Patescibacteria group bacterium]|nr:phosphoribosylaminoimidazolesuccinocarboxamide synthase [Patescibacteria group bacterium]